MKNSRCFEVVYSCSCGLSVSMTPGLNIREAGAIKIRNKMLEALQQHRPGPKCGPVKMAVVGWFRFKPMRDDAPWRILLGLPAKKR
jgi:hypothetical protein